MSAYILKRYYREIEWGLAVFFLNVYCSSNRYLEPNSIQIVALVISESGCVVLNLCLYWKEIAESRIENEN